MSDKRRAIRAGDALGVDSPGIERLPFWNRFRKRPARMPRIERGLERNEGDMRMLAFDDRWIWDFWLAHDGDRHHLFFLQAPRSLGDPERRHAHATVGHAVSTDLRDWEVVQDALGPGPPGEWDDRAIWTGSVVRAGDGWAMLYTGTSLAEDGLVQRIGLATSPDLLTWTRHPANPVLEAPTAYEQLDPEHWYELAWRDPWVLPDPEGDGWVALICARVPYGPGDGRGVIACARSRDLVDWVVGPPVTLPGDYGHLEVPQVVATAGRWHLLFSADRVVCSAAHPDHAAGVLLTGVRYLTARHPLGPYLPATDRVLDADESGTRYSGRIVEHEGRSYLLTFDGMDETGRFVGAIGDPVEVGVTAQGIERRLAVER